MTRVATISRNRSSLTRRIGFRDDHPASADIFPFQCFLDVIMIGVATIALMKSRGRVTCILDRKYDVRNTHADLLHARDSGATFRGPICMADSDARLESRRVGVQVGRQIM